MAGAEKYDVSAAEFAQYKSRLRRVMIRKSLAGRARITITMTTTAS
jgi:hypothetical protein